jgi:PHD/YefM family antitoxin component YafN of YafNO toxin-antitoxin module
MDETRVSSSQFQADFAALSARARLEPIIITDGESDALVVVSAKEWSRLKRLESELPSCWIEAVRVAAAPDEPAVPEAELRLRRRLQGVSL